MLTALLLLAFIIALLAIPVSVSFQVSHKQTLQGQVVLGWAFGLIRVTLPLSKTNASESPPKDKPRRTQPLKKRRRSTRGEPWTLLRSRPFRRRIFRFIAKLWHAFHKQNIRIRVRLGLGDPADTGQLWAVLGPVSALLANLNDARIELEPEFMEDLFELEGSGTIRFVPLRLLTLTIALILSPTIWQGVKHMRQAA